MKRYVKLSVDAEAYYSGATYYEEVFITEEIYDKIKSELGSEICLGELDGKHSQVDGDLEVKYYTEESLMRQSNVGNDGDNLFYEVVGTMESCGYEEVDDILWSIEEEIKALRVYEEVVVNIRKENKEKLMEFVKGLQ